MKLQYVEEEEDTRRKSLGRERVTLERMCHDPVETEE